MYGHGIAGGVVPSFVHWRELSGHPTSRLQDQDASLVELAVSAPSNHEVHRIAGHTTCVDMNNGGNGGCELKVVLSTPKKGNVTFTSSNPKGIIMPGFDDVTHESYNKTR